MSIKMLLKTSFSSLFNHKVRSILSMIGIIIGITSVIAIFSLGQGYKEHELEQFKNTYHIDEGKVDVLCYSAGNTSENVQFNAADLQLVNQITGIENAEFSKEKKEFNQELEICGNKKNRRIVSKFDADIPFELVCGKEPTKLNSEAKEKVVLIDAEVAEIISGNSENLESALDYRIKIKDEVFRVIGVYQCEDDEWGGDTFVIPEQTFSHYFKGVSNRNSITLSLAQGQTVASIRKAVLDKLKKDGSMHTLATYQLSDMAKYLDQGNEVLSMIQGVFTAVGGISLLVACIGVMNMMFIAVAERTREIGIRRALGAKKREIRMQFLFEGCLLTIIGGIIGYILGFGLANLLGSQMGIAIHPDLVIVFAAIMISTAVGLIASLLPAIKAANKNLIEILR